MDTPTDSDGAESKKDEQQLSDTINEVFNYAPETDADSTDGGTINIDGVDIEATPDNKPKRFAKVNAALIKHQTTAYIILALLLIVAAGTLIAMLHAKPSNTAFVTGKIPTKQIIVSPLTGVELKDKSLASRPVTAVMIENSPDARPQSGLNQAGVVFEAVAEGGITRFMALYQEAQPKLIGPVRSLRPYYFNWAKGFDASIAHVGGSTVALNMVRSNGNRDLDQFFNASTYWRSSDRYAPHNVYTDFTNLNALNKSKGYTHSKFTSFERKKDQPAKTPTASVINVDISGPLYNPSFHYDKKSNSYIRYQDGAPHIDRESGKPIEPKVVVVLKISMHLDADGDHMDISAIGKGQAIVFQDGTYQKINWSKSSPTSQIKLTDDSGKPVKLNAGMTWFTVVAPDRSVTWHK